MALNVSTGFSYHCTHTMCTWNNLPLVRNSLVLANIPCVLHQPPGALSDRLCWDPTSKQAVHFLSPDCALGTSPLHQLNYTSEFNTATGELRFNFTAS